MKGYVANQVISGTYGELWIDDEYVAEVMSFKAELNIKYSAIGRVQHLVDGQKMTGIEGKGEVKMHHVESTISRKISEKLKAGKCPSFKINGKLSDPDASGTERVVLYECKFDKASLADWEQGKEGEKSYSFTFEDWDFPETIN